MSKSPIVLQKIRILKNTVQTVEKKDYNKKIKCDEDTVNTDFEEHLQVDSKFILRKRNLDFHQQLLEDLKNAPVQTKRVKGTEIELPYMKSVIYDGIRVNMRMDVGPNFAHEEDHWNLEVMNEFGTVKLDRHIYVDDKGDIIRIVDTMPKTKSKPKSEIVIYER